MKVEKINHPVQFFCNSLIQFWFIKIRAHSVIVLDFLVAMNTFVLGAAKNVRMLLPETLVDNVRVVYNHFCFHLLSWNFSILLCNTFLRLNVKINSHHLFNSQEYLKRFLSKLTKERRTLLFFTIIRNCYESKFEIKLYWLLMI